jgi:hypothetical protein
VHVGHELLPELVVGTNAEVVVGVHENHTEEGCLRVDGVVQLRLDSRLLPARVLVEDEVTIGKVPLWTRVQLVV